MTKGPLIGPPPNVITLGIRILACQFWKDTSIQSIADPHQSRTSETWLRCHGASQRDDEEIWAHIDTAERFNGVWLSFRLSREKVQQTTWKWARKKNGQERKGFDIDVCSFIWRNVEQQCVY